MDSPHVYSLATGSHTESDGDPHAYDNVAEKVGAHPKRAWDGGKYAVSETPMADPYETHVGSDFYSQYTPPFLTMSPTSTYAAAPQKPGVAPIPRMVLVACVVAVVVACHADWH